MAIKEQPLDDYSKACQARGLDVCPVELTGIDRWKANRAVKQAERGKYYTLDQIEASRAKHNQSRFSFTRFLQSLF